VEPTFVITHEWLHQHGKSGCGWPNQQLRILGVPANPQKGWLSRLIGTTITIAQRDAFEAFHKNRGLPSPPPGQSLFSPSAPTLGVNDVTYFQVLHRRPWQARCDICRERLEHPFFWTRAVVPGQTICFKCHDIREARIHHWNNPVVGPPELEPGDSA
jgi:hypothetical protein